MRNKILVVFALSVLAFACKSLVPSNTDAVSYNTHIKAIVENYCTTCHSGETPAGGVDLGNYSEVRALAENGALLNRINSSTNPMPPGGLMPRMSRMQFDQWKQNGFTEKGSAVVKNELEDYVFDPPKIDVVNVDEESGAFDFFKLMGGHWTGAMNIMGEKYSWFAWDYRPISEAHVHGIYEAGSMGNLFTGFFLADFNGKKTIMARNGGLLNGIYRTSYFVLDQYKKSGSKQYFRLVDAYGGKDIMWMELTFSGKDGKNLKFNSYTSRFGLNGYPRSHMKFDAERAHPKVSSDAARALNYPQKKVEFSFPNGLPEPKWPKSYGTITSASYMNQDTGKTLLEMASIAGDPITIKDLDHLSKLKINFPESGKAKGKNLKIYLSLEPIVGDDGIYSDRNKEQVASMYTTVYFSDFPPGTKDFTYTYLHPGTYYVTVFADLDGNEYMTNGDFCAPSVKVQVKPGGFHEVSPKYAE